MNIVLNECEWAEKMLSAHELGDNPSETLTRIARYYADNQYPKRKIRRMLDEFVLQCDPSANLSMWSDLLDRITKSCNKYKAIKLDSIHITEAELGCIQSLKGQQARRLAFSLLCAAKYWDAVSEKNNHWANTQDKDILQMANVKTSVRRQSLLFSRLRDDGMIRFSRKVDNLNVQVLFTNNDSPVAIEIRDFRNLGYQYMRYYGGPYFECENCGVVSKLSDPTYHPSQKYCSKCAAAVRIAQNVNSVMRIRGIKN